MILIFIDQLGDLIQISEDAILSLHYRQNKLIGTIWQNQYRIEIGISVVSIPLANIEEQLTEPISQAKL